MWGFNAFGFNFSFSTIGFPNFHFTNFQMDKTTHLSIKWFKTLLLIGGQRASSLATCKTMQKHTRPFPLIGGRFSLMGKFSIFTIFPSFFSFLCPIKYINMTYLIRYFCSNEYEQDRQ
jgi:hypothetical protein